MVFAIGSFIQTEAGLQSQGCPAVHTERTAGFFFFGRQVLNGVINVGQHIGHHQFTGIACLIEFLIGREEFLVIPGYISEAFYLVEIEVGTEEAGQCGILDRSLFILTLINVSQQGIDIAQCSPGPSSSTGGNDAVGSSQQFIRQLLLYIYITLLVVG